MAKRQAENKRKSDEACCCLTAGTNDVAAASSASVNVGVGNGSDVDWDRVEAETAEHLLGVDVDVKRRDRRVESRDLWNVLVLALTLLLLELEGDTTDGSLLDTLHEVGGETGYLVAETL